MFLYLTGTLYIIQPTHLLEGAGFLLLFIVCILLYIVFYLVRRATKSAKKRRLSREFSEMISHLAISDTIDECEWVLQQPGQKKRLERWLQDRFSRRLLIRELVNTAKSMRGQSADNIAWLYSTYQLDKDSLENLKNKHWHIKARAIQQLAELQQRKHVVKIYRFTNDKNDHVRNEARVAVVKMHGFEGLRFLDVISYPITEWEQISLLHELPTEVNIEYTTIANWLKSANQSVVEFTLRLVAHYQAHILHDDVVACLQSANRTIRQKAIQALGEIPAPGTPAILTHQFEKEELLNQLSIISVLKEIGTEQEVSFLINCLHHPHINVQAESARAIGQIGSKGLSLVQKHVNPAVYPWNILLPQLTQELLV